MTRDNVTGGRDGDRDGYDILVFIMYLLGKLIVLVYLIFVFYLCADSKLTKNTQSLGRHCD